MKKFLIRAILGMLLIFCINQYLTYKGLSMCVGLNAISFLTSGTLGSPLRNYGSENFMSFAQK